MRRLVFVLVLILFFVLEAKVSVAGIRPNLTVLLVYYVGLRFGHTRGLLFGALVGIIADSISGGMLGPNLLSKGAAGFLSAHMTSGLFRWTPVLGFMGLAVITILDGALSFGAITAFSSMPTTVSNAAVTVSAQAVLNAVVGMYLRPGHD